MATNFTTVGGARNVTSGLGNSTLSIGNTTGLGGAVGVGSMASFPPPTKEDVTLMLTLGLLIEIMIPQYSDANLTAVVDDLLNGKHGNLTMWITPITSHFIPGLGDPTPTLMALQAYLKSMPHNNQFWHMATVYIILQVLTLFTLCVRFYAKKMHHGTFRLRPEDFWACLAYILSLCYTIGLILGSIHGKIGYHLWDISFNNLKRNLIYIFSLTYFYPACMLSVKMALVSFYWSLSPNKIIRRVLVGVFILIVCNFITANLMLTFACKPVDWWNNILAAKCINRVPMNTAWGTLNVLSDVALWCLPIPAVWRLHLKLREKVGLIIMFSIGSVACIAAIIRVVITNRFYGSTDITYGEAEISLWALLEIDIAIILLSAPAFKIVLMKHAPRLIGYTRRLSSRNNSKRSTSDEKRPRDDGRGGVPTIGSARGYMGDNCKIVNSKMNTDVSTFTDLKGSDPLSPVEEVASPISRSASKKFSTAFSVVNPFQDFREKEDDEEEGLTFPPAAKVAADGQAQKYGMQDLSSPSGSGSSRDSTKYKDDDINDITQAEAGRSDRARNSTYQ